MRNQIAAAKRMGVRAETINSDNQDHWEQVEDAVGRNEVDILLISPERLANERFRAEVLGKIAADLSFVIHYQTPGSVVAYYQQVGRAGRALDAAYGVLLSGEEETEITDYFINSAFPTRAEVREILDALDRELTGLSTREIEGAVNISTGRIQKTIELLSLEAPSPIAKDGTKWQLTAAALSSGFWERAERLTELRRREQEQMQEYVGLDSGHMEFLVRALDGDPEGVSRPGLPLLATEPDPALVRTAIAFLRRTSLPFEPRKRWPSAGLRHYGLHGLIVPAFRAQPGKALCFWGDAGWGGLVRQGKYRDGHFSDELVGACRKLAEDWSLEPAPEWVTCIPSRRHPELVPDFARRLANSLGLPFRPVLVKAEDRPEQKTMENSTQQARNVDGSLTLTKEALPDGPLLLVDDMVDSRWTFTVAAWLLRSSGSGEVWPLALAQVGG